MEESGGEKEQGRGRKAPSKHADFGKRRSESELGRLIVKRFVEVERKAKRNCERI